MLPSPVTAARADAAVTFENVENRATSGQGPTGKAIVESLQDFSGTPSVTAILLENQLDELVWSLMRARVRCPAMMVEPAAAALLIAIEPLVARVATDTITQAQLGHRPVSVFKIVDKVSSFEHRIGLQPGHASSSHKVGASVTHVPGHL